MLTLKLLSERGTNDHCSNHTFHEFLCYVPVFRLWNVLSFVSFPHSFRSLPRIWPSIRPTNAPHRIKTQKRLSCSVTSKGWSEPDSSRRLTRCICTRQQCNQKRAGLRQRVVITGGWQRTVGSDPTQGRVGLGWGGRVPWQFRSVPE